MVLKIHSIDGKGDIKEERVWIDVLEDCNLKYYMICDTTYTSDDTISNELRHMFWFENRNVTKGDWVVLHTKEGKYYSAKNNRGKTTHHHYWNLGRTVWNKDGDAAVLFKISHWKTTKA